MWLSIGTGIASVVAAVWVAAKVFRIGLLMYGKPPDVRTLIRWVGPLNSYPGGGWGLEPTW